MLQILMMMILDFFMLILMIMPSNLFNLHPLILSLSLSLYTIFLSLKLNKFNNLYWYSYIIYLIMVGGILILFLYLTSISNNELMNLTSKYLMFFFLKLMFLIMLYFLTMKYLGWWNMYMMNNFMDLENFMNQMNEDLLEYKNLYIMFNLDLNIFLIFYLFIVMVICVLICLKNSSPLRQMLN